MKEVRCSCGSNFLVPTNGTETKVIFDRKKPLELIYAGVDVSINREYLFEVCKECSTIRSLSTINRFMSINTKHQVSVDWDEYRLGYVRDNIDVRYINNVLDRLKILSGYAENNWIIMSQKNGCLNPRLGNSVNLYFVSSDDALAYARTFKHWKVHIMRIKDVIEV